MNRPICVLRRQQQGRSQIEIVIVSVLISILVAIAAERLWVLTVDAEKTAVLLMRYRLQAGLNLQMAKRIADNRHQRKHFKCYNPMDTLAKKPHNYIGEMSRPDFDTISGGSWFFDTDTCHLVYVVYHQRYFQTSLTAPHRAQFRVKLVYNKGDDGSSMHDYVVGLDLVAEPLFYWRDGALLGF